MAKLKIPHDISHIPLDKLIYQCYNDENERRYNMIKIYCNENDESHFTRCLSYNMNKDICNNYENECDLCPYYDCNVQFIHHNSDRIIIETDEIDLDVKACLYNTFYNFRCCGVVDLDKEEDCKDCRFWYENIEVINYKEESK